jgi:hypothetical protein
VKHVDKRKRTLQQQQITDLRMLPHLLVNARVCEAQRLALCVAYAQRGHVVCLLHQHVQQRRLAVVQPANNLRAGSNRET